MSLTSPDIFSSIDNNDVESVKNYIASSGDLTVKSAKGLSLIAHASVNLLHTQRRVLESMEDEDEDDFLNQQQQTSTPPAGTSMDYLDGDMRKASDIGIALIMGGLPLDARAGRTNRSITCSDFVKSRFPEVFKEWDAANVHRKITVDVEENVDMENKLPSAPRKI